MLIKTIIFVVILALKVVSITFNTIGLLLIYIKSIFRTYFNILKHEEI